jgi:hypothetical protein
MTSIGSDAQKTGVPEKMAAGPFISFQTAKVVVNQENLMQTAKSLQNQLFSKHREHILASQTASQSHYEKAAFSPIL